MKILSIETSCDETAAAILDGEKVLSNVVASQIDIHKKIGGIVPEVASRAHVEKILPVIEEALKKAGVDIKDIDLIAATIGPGLIGSLLVGVETAKTLAYAYEKPIIGINHLEGHIYANWIENKPELPAVILIVSGGHTSLVHMKKMDDFKIIGETRDDAAGEAFDKVAALLGLEYPGGPAIEEAAQEAKLKMKNVKLKIKEPIKIKFPRPMLNQDDFSFSGLKTAVLYESIKLKKQLSNNRSTIEQLPSNLRSQIAYEFQKALVDSLVIKTIKAAQKYKVRSILLSGGVAANKLLRTELEKRARGENFKFHVPSFEYCTDNAAMIGMAAYIKSLKAKPQPWSQIEADANLDLFT